MISMICVTGGGLWAFHQARERIYYVKYGHPWWPKLYRHVEAHRRRKQRHRRGKGKSNPETTKSDDNSPNLDHLTIAIKVEEDVDPEAVAAHALKNKEKKKKKKKKSLKLYLHLTEIVYRNPHATAICSLIFTMISIMMLAFYFRPYLVFLFNVFLVFTGTSSMYTCISAFLSNFPFSEHGWYQAKMKWIPVLFGSQKYTYTGALFALLSFTFCATWFFVRSDVYGFVLLDIINIAVCLRLLSLVRMPNMKVLTIVLVVMYFYDAFMVFGTPYLTENGCSIMVQVATGIDDCREYVPQPGRVAANPTPPVFRRVPPEKFPMLIMVPQMDPMNECMDMVLERSYPISILGLGDIALPGYLITHCFTLSGFTNKGRLIYGFVALSGYALGLVATFAALMMYQVAQPALIYLIPCTLLPVLVVAAIRKEFRGMWKGRHGWITILVADLQHFEYQGPHG
uniref:Signal peptide peptidase-like 2B n=2 Tax=Caenorhabditis japonica TaxID=281687 RepID=A0A8R1DU71_CAEJA